MRSLHLPSGPESLPGRRPVPALGSCSLLAPEQVPRQVKVKAKEADGAKTALGGGVGTVPRGCWHSVPRKLSSPFPSQELVTLNLWLEIAITG